MFSTERGLWMFIIVFFIAFSFFPMVLLCVRITHFIIRHRDFQKGAMCFTTVLSLIVGFNSFSAMLVYLSSSSLLTLSEETAK